jgi:Raf kinase inhibitor-like YbhB/YbcL family protein
VRKLPSRGWACVVVLVACSRSEAGREGQGSSAPAAVTSAPEAMVAPAPAAPGPITATAKTLTLSSPAFEAGSPIPPEHTCDGANLSPPLAIAGVPDGTRSIALFIEDPDAPDPAAPKTIWAHWVAYDLPASTRRLDTGAGNPQKLGRSGKNDWGATGYRGPCPPIGKHRYFVKLFALDRELGDLHEPTKSELLRAMEGHVLAQGELMGTYKK